MATIDELLNEASDEMEYGDERFTPDSRYETYPYEDAATIYIENKKIGNMEGQISVSGERDSQYIVFEHERYMDGVDLNDKLIQIHYERPDGKGDNSPVVNVEVSEDHIRFGWIIPAKATELDGKLKVMPFAYGEAPTGDSYVMKDLYLEYTIHDGNDIDGGIEEPDDEWYLQFLRRMDQYIAEAQESEQAAAKSETNAKESETNAKASELAAAQSAADAQQYTGQIEDAKNSAQESAEKAKASETAAKASETAAKTSETNAKESETASATSAAAAKVSEDNAAASASAAATSESNAEQYAQAAKDSKDAAKVSEDNAAASATAAAASEDNAAASEAAAKQSEDNAAASAAAAKVSEDNAAASETAAATSEAAAKTSETNAKASETAAAASAAAAKASEDHAAQIETNVEGMVNDAQAAKDDSIAAKTAAEIAQQAAETAKADAETAKDDAENSAISARSYAVGDTQSRPGEIVDNAKYYKEEAQRILAAAVGGSLLPMGTVAFEMLPAVPEVGWMYNISNDFISDERFNDGGGIFYRAGANVYWTSEGKWDVLTGVQVTGVKGDAEQTFRVGNVNLTKENIGLSNVENKSSETIRSEVTADNVTDALGYTPADDTNVVHGVKGGAETDYRKGNVNLTPENIGAVNKAGDTMSGDLTIPTEAGAFIGNLQGNADTADEATHAVSADTATQLEILRKILLSGPVSGETFFDGSADVTIATALEKSIFRYGGSETSGDLQTFQSNRSYILNGTFTHGPLGDSVKHTGWFIKFGADGATTNAAALFYRTDTTAYELYKTAATSGSAEWVWGKIYPVDSVPKLATPRTISLSGTMQGSASFDGSKDVEIRTSLLYGCVSNEGDDIANNWVKIATFTKTPDRILSAAFLLYNAYGVSSKGGLFRLYLSSGAGKLEWLMATNEGALSDYRCILTKDSNGKYIQADLYVYLKNDWDTIDFHLLTETTRVLKTYLCIPYITNLRVSNTPFPDMESNQISITSTVTNTYAFTANNASKLKTPRTINGSSFDGTQDIVTKTAFNYHFSYSGDKECINILRIPLISNSALTTTCLISIASSYSVPELFYISINRSSKAATGAKITSTNFDENLSFYVSENESYHNIYVYFNKGYYRGHTCTIIGNLYNRVYDIGIEFISEVVDVSSGIPDTWKEIVVNQLQNQAGTVENANKLKVKDATFTNGNSYRIALPFERNMHTLFDTTDGLMLRMRNTTGTLGGNKGDCELKIGESNAHAGIIRLNQHNSSYSAIIIPSPTANSADNVLRLPNKDGTIALTSDILSYAAEPAATMKANTFMSTVGSDYAEFLEWEDGNPEAEDRVGYFVTTKGKKIRKASEGDYIAGITSGNPSVAGNGDDYWRGRYLYDEMNRPIKEEVLTPVTKSVEKEVLVLDDSGNPIPKVEIVIDEETGEEVERPMVDEEGDAVYETKIEIEEVETGEVRTEWKYKENPEYDPARPYVERKDRPEWDFVGMVGVLPVYDDGTCWEDGFCQPADGGIATAAFEYIPGKTYRVMERVSENIVKIQLK